MRRLLPLLLSTGFRLLLWCLLTADLSRLNLLIGVAVALGFAANRANVCDADGGRNCIVSWTLLNQTADGSWRRVFHDPATFNNAPARVAEEATCAAEGFTGRSLVVPGTFATVEAAPVGVTNS